jgi:DNA-3-methyladenine glycosylase
MKIPAKIYQQGDVVALSQFFLGKVLCSYQNGVLTSGKIVETEAYCGATDKACHAHFNRRTHRTAVMFAEGGRAYVYLCYGIHYLFNIVTNEAEKADAILVRAIEPLEGIATMQERRKTTNHYKLTSGPALLTQALGITTAHYGLDLQGDSIWIEDRGLLVLQEEIVASPRIGVAYAGEDALLPWRFRIKNNRWTSKAEANYTTTKLM